MFLFARFEPDVEKSLGIVALLVPFAVLYLWMVWAYIKVNSLLLYVKRSPH